jgi:CSLREA domain-containing protein
LGQYTSKLTQTAFMKYFPLSRSLIGMALLCAATFALCAALGVDASAQAPFPEIIVVNSTGDGDDAFRGDGQCETAVGNGVCTLRAAIEEANAHAGGDGIFFSIPTSDPGYSNGTWTINLARSLPDVTDAMQINAPGANKLVVQRNASAQFRIFNVITTGTVNFSGLTITNGNLSNDNGGGIQNANSSTVNVTNCTISSNSTTTTIGGGGGGGGGGGIANSNNGTVNVTNCMLSGNSALNAGSGGGIFNSSSGTVNVTKSTVSNNNSELNFGGGIASYGTLNVASSTLSGNQANFGGGIFNLTGGRANVTNSTLSGNSANNQGGGILNGETNSVTTVKNSIVALNAAGFSGPDVGGHFNSSGFNLIGKTDGSAGFTAATDQTGTAAAPLDPKLDPNGLKDNGGPTDTIALLTGSPAIDKGTSSGLTGILTTDQRGVGYARTINKSVPNATGGDGTDIGAFEFGAHISAVSHKTHGTAGAFDVKLPLFGSVLGVECRQGGSSHVFTVILTFPTAVTVGSVSVTPDPKAPGATASVSSASVSGSKVTVNLTGVSNAQRIVVTLSAVSDGINSNDVIVPMGVLLGDTNNNRSVTSNDVSLTQSKVGQAVSKTTFREDVNLDGVLNTTDVNLVQSKVGTKLP